MDSDDFSKGNMDEKNLSPHFQDLLLNDIHMKEITDFYEEYHQRAYIVALAKCHDKELAKDAMQEAFTYFVRHWSKYGQMDKSTRVSHFFRCVRSRLIDMVRKKDFKCSSLQECNEYDDALIQLDGIEELYDDTSIDQERPVPPRDMVKKGMFNPYIEEALARLAPKEFECLLYAVQGFSTEEIGELLQLKKNSVSSYISEAKRKLKKFYQPPKKASQPRKGPQP
ncbi:RNA polymerase sigma factor [Tengunoibacter tsumagoiensis]|uniref:HTH luxR-type domain-containing protein n=1 Tax=Tengunoibacter tsumagoiensis TaxID=2014871 RepID=A0A401ZXG5_9CHLR|nr:sigma-70 family RNA polymerase sigma factor [Tengunoibacter tsumagoiensis]GCE11527.1 hypothetical protein KTT_13860 [Tengunoibacter tsumagoiensis]